MNCIKTFYILLLALIFSSCQKYFLDQVPDDRLTIEQVFKRLETSERYLANVYSYIRDETYLTNAAPWIGLSDEGDVSYDRSSDYQTFLINIGNWSPASGYYNSYFTEYYKGIRSATTYIQNIGGNPQMTPNEIVVRIAEARFVRAYLYFMLLRTYGPITILYDDLIPGDLQTTDPLLSLPRNSFDECVEYISNELDIASLDLPVHFTFQSPGEHGRATRIASMALKSRLLLYAASPLFNGNSDYANFKNPDGKPLVNTQYDANKWNLAAKAAKDIIDVGVLSLYKKYDGNNYKALESYRDVFLDPWNPEWIFARIQNNILGWQRASTPRSVGGYSSTGPPQWMVDSYFMANGHKPITGYNSDGSPIINAASNYTETGFSTVKGVANVSNMYANREPRFYANVNYNRAPWINRATTIIETNFSGESGGSASWDYSKTGYFNRKNVAPAYDPILTNNPSRPYLMMRYAEIILNYVEALYEVDSSHPDILLYLNMIRERAGIAKYGSAINEVPVPTDLREAIRHERKIELAFEHHRYFDTRRWKIAEQTDNGNFWGMNVTKNLPEFYKRTIFETRVFRKSFYLFPIPQTEINKNKNLVQNPYW